MSAKKLKKEELRRLLQTIRDIEQDDEDRPIGVTVNVSYMSREDLEEVLSQVKLEIKTLSKPHRTAVDPEHEMIEALNQALKQAIIKELR